MPQTFFQTSFIFLTNNALFVIHSIIHSIIQQKYSFKKFIHSKKHANYSFKEFIHSKKIQNYSFKKFIHSKKSKIIYSTKFIHSKKNPKLIIQKKYSFKWKMDYRPGLICDGFINLSSPKYFSVVLQVDGDITFSNHWDQLIWKFEI